MYPREKGKTMYWEDLIDEWTTHDEPLHCPLCGEELEFFEQSLTRKVNNDGKKYLLPQTFSCNNCERDFTVENYVTIVVETKIVY